LAQTAEGALGKVGDMLQRMRELAVQSSNATNSKSDREALQSELSQLRDEVDRVAKTTTFNGQKLLEGSFTGGVFQVGANSGDNISVGSLGNVKVDSLGNSSYSVGSISSSAVTQASVTSASVSLTIQGATASAVATIEQDANATQTEVTGRTIEAINAKTADTGVTAFLSEDGTTIELRATAAPTGTTGTTASVAVGTAAATSLTAITTAEGKGIDKVDISTQSGAWEAMQRIDNAIDKVNTARGDLGALQTRFEKAVENIDIQNENISAARSRITDADFAKETANLSRTQILQQAGTAMVAQANQLPQQVLSLLR
ncbi:MULTISPECIES: flagellin, partial [unclassified Delftia]